MRRTRPRLAHGYAAFIGSLGPGYVAWQVAYATADQVQGDAQAASDANLSSAAESAAAAYTAAMDPAVAAHDQAYADAAAYTALQGTFAQISLSSAAAYANAASVLPIAKAQAASNVAVAQAEAAYRVGVAQVAALESALGGRPLLPTRGRRPRTQAEGKRRPWTLRDGHGRRPWPRLVPVNRCRPDNSFFSSRPNAWAKLSQAQTQAEADAQEESVAASSFGTWEVAVATGLAASWAAEGSATAAHAISTGTADASFNASNAAAYQSTA